MLSSYVSARVGGSLLIDGLPSIIPTMFVAKSGIDSTELLICSLTSPAGTPSTSELIGLKVACTGAGEVVVSRPIGMRADSAAS